MSIYTYLKKEREIQKTHKDIKTDTRMGTVGQTQRERERFKDGYRSLLSY